MPTLVTRSSMPALDEYIEEIRSIWDTHWLTNMGTKHNELTEELQKYLGVPCVSLVVNGHMALENAIRALKLEGEIITTPFTFASTTHAIVRTGLTPVFCDIDPSDYTMDVSGIEALITDKTSAIMPVHVYGNICNVEEIQSIADRHGLKVIYDAAHAFGETLDGVGIGNFGDISCFSFHATKVFHTIEGGAAVFKDKSLADTLHYLRDFGILDEERIVETGGNAKMNEFCAAMGLCNLRHLDAEILKRKAVYERYTERLEGVKGLRLNKIRPEVKSNYAYFPIVVDTQFAKTRDEIQKLLAENGIYSRKYFYPLTSEFDCYRDKYNSNLTPVALDVSHKVLTLPMFADLALEEVDRICDIILQT